MRIAGLCAAAAAAVLMAVASCTTVTGGDASVNAEEAPAYRTSMSLSSSQSAASSSARESERQAAMTTKAVQSTCETLATSSAEAIDTVNAYVGAYNDEGGDVAATAGPAVDALKRSADAVAHSITDIVPAEVKKALTAWVDGARAAADAISGNAGASEFNQRVDALNEARTNALRLCDDGY